MTETRHQDHAGRHRLLQPGALFQAFKYAVYTLLIIDFFLFLRLEWAASDHTFAGGVSWTELTEAFSATIDTGAWVVLLLIFELQTYVIPEEKLRGGLAWTLNALLAVSYALIVWAFYGYCAKTWLLYDVSALLGASGLCDLPGDGWALLTDFDEYTAFDAESCASFARGPDLLQINGTSIVADVEGLAAARLLAWTDVANAAAWLGVVVVLEVDVRLESLRRFGGLAFRLSYAVKALLYSILLLAAIYWGIAGDFVDFWDAFLWLVAFAFIEMNILGSHEKHQESAFASSGAGQAGVSDV
jgi:hypothetical protein